MLQDKCSARMALWREHLLCQYALQSHLKILWIPSQFGLKWPFLLALANCACTRLSGESCACTYAQLSAESTACTCTALCREQHVRIALHCVLWRELCLGRLLTAAYRLLLLVAYRLLLLVAW